MKKITIVLIISLISVLTLSGQKYVDIRLSSAFSEEHLEYLEENNPQKLDYMNWCLDNSFTIIDAGLEKTEQMPYLKHFDRINKIVGENVEDLDVFDINIYLLDFERKLDKRTVYRIGDTGKAIIFESNSKLAENFKNHQNGN